MPQRPKTQRVTKDCFDLCETLRLSAFVAFLIIADVGVGGESRKLLKIYQIAEKPTPGPVYVVLYRKIAFLVG